MDYENSNTDGIAEEIISKLQELNQVLNDLIRRCRNEEDISDTPSS